MQPNDSGGFMTCEEVTEPSRTRVDKESGVTQEFLGTNRIIAKAEANKGTRDFPLPRLVLCFVCLVQPARS